MASECATPLRPLRGTAWAAAVMLAACIGCGRSEPTARLTGTVVVGGGPPQASLMVVVENIAKGVSATAPVDSAGRFEVFTAPGRGVPEGTYRVALITPPRPIGDIAAALKPDFKPTKAATKEIPARFRSPQTSGLTIDVKLPQTRLDIDVPTE